MCLNLFADRALQCATEEATKVLASPVLSDLLESHMRDCQLDGEPGQPGMTLYKHWFFSVDYGAWSCVAVNEQNAAELFHREFERRDRIDTHLIVRIDELEDDRSLSKMSDDEFDAMARQALEQHVAWLKKPDFGQAEHSSQRPKAVNYSRKSTDEQPGPLKRYRIWFRAAEIRRLLHAADNAEKAAEWFHAARREHESDLTTYTLLCINEVGKVQAGLLDRRTWPKHVKGTLQSELFAPLKTLSSTLVRRP